MTKLAEYCAHVIDDTLYFTTVYEQAGPLFRPNAKGLTTSSDFDKACFGAR